ncbi:hypothetical protein PVK06_014116 [Gossypium arboreum]|uniref:Uncharacterized protein n=1 Tax=Gossypium arboreum TaxID=29729 RepID=A0ABR0PTP8_GOSAR|nr:hypothetical protein PVK06_014116 [Gossypium arboreum]
MVTASGDWNWELLTLVLPVSALHLITAVLPPSKAAGDDRIAWHWFCASKFSVAKKYAHFPRLEGSANPVDWHLVWHCHIPQQQQPGGGFDEYGLGEMSLEGLETWLKINTDGSCYGSCQHSSVGGVCRGSTGDCYFGLQ